LYITKVSPLLKTLHNLPSIMIAILVFTMNFNDLIPITLNLTSIFDLSYLPLITSPQFVNHVRRTREAHPTKTLIAGNVVTGEMVEELILSGADIVKVMEQIRMRWKTCMLPASSFEVMIIHYPIPYTYCLYV
jgi:IMP dehydrogenase / GMP reductase domain